MLRRKVLAAIACLGTALVTVCSVAQSPPAIYRSDSWDSAHCSSSFCYSRPEAIDAGSIASSTTQRTITIESRDATNEWVVRQKLTNPDARYNGGLLGPTFAIAGDYLMTFGTSQRYNYEDVVYVYKKTGGVWSYLQTFPITRPAEYDTSVVKFIVMSGDTALVSAISYDYGPHPPVSLNRVHVYLRQSDGKYALRALLSPPLGREEEEPLPVALHGATALVASAGSVYLYERSAAGWPLRHVFAPTESNGGLSFAAIHGDTIALGAPGANDVEDTWRFGRVYIHRRSASGGWPLKQVLQPPAKLPSEPFLLWQFGQRIVLDDARMIVSGSHLDLGVLYEKRSDVWTRVAKLAGRENAWTERLLLTNRTLIASYYIADGSSDGRFIFELPELGVLPEEAQ